MNVRNEIIVLCDALKITETELAKKIGVTYETINHWKNERKTIDISNIEKLYSFAYSNKVRFNNIYEQLLKEDCQKNEVVLFHGAKKPFSMPIDFIKYSKSTNDFGTGFYLGETFEQAANYISFIDRDKVYSFKLNLENLKTYKFNVDTKWMIAIAYYKGWLNDYKNCSFVKNIIDEINDCDIIIAPIADNRMFDIITEYVEGTITDEQCKHALAATNLGFQYVLKTDKAVKQIKLIKEMFVCKKEKEKCIENRVFLIDNGLQKVRMARIEYKGKGKYIEEILK